MTQFFLFAAFAGGLAGLAGILLGNPAMEIPALGAIGLACLSGIFARFQQTIELAHLMDEHHTALLKALEQRR
jgi:hypothetical protein